MKPSQVFYSLGLISALYGGPYVQYTKENISAQTRVEIHKQNIQYTIRSIGSRKYVSVHDKFGKYTTTYLTTSE
jgi:hypothetical protein